MECCQPRRSPKVKGYERVKKAGKRIHQLAWKETGIAQDRQKWTSMYLRTHHTVFRMLFLALISCALFITESKSEQPSSELPANSFHEPGSSEVQSESPLLSAVTKGDLEKVVTLLKEGVDIYATDCNGISSMHIAVLNRRKDIVLALLERKFNINKVFRGSGTVLEFAIKNSFDMVQFLVELGANVNQIFEPNGETYLHRAIRCNDFSFTRKLIQIGAHLEAMDWSNNSPLMLSVKENDPATFNLLAASGADVSKGNLLHLAVKYNLTDFVRTLLERGLPVNGKDEQGYTPIALAVRNDNTDIAEILVAFRADLNDRKDGSTLLDMAEEKRSHKSMKWLLQKGLKIDDDGRSLMEAAIDRDDVDYLKFFFEHGAKINGPSSYRGNLVHYAAEKGSAHSIRWLADHGVDLNSTGSFDGYTPLHLAAMNNRLSAVRTLVELGACLENVDYFGQTPLHVAAASNRLQAVKTLSELGAGLNSRDFQGKTPLDIANGRKYTEISEYLRKQMVSR